MSQDARLVVTRYKQGILSCILQDNRMIRADFSTENSSIVGNIYIAKVLNVVPSLHAAFLEYAPGKKCYLPLGKEVPAVLNRDAKGKLSSGDLLVIQIIKDAIKTKEPMATTNISVTGQYCVITSENKRIGFSDKLKKEQKEQLSQYLPKEHSFGMIVRTNAGELLEQGRIQDFTNEITLLNEKMHSIMETVSYRTCYSVLYQAPASYLIGIRDTYHYLYQRIVTDDQILYDEIKQYILENMPDDIDKLQFYEDTSYSMKKLYSLEHKITEALSQKVWLKSGAYLIIQPTEALVAIDVNSGKNDSRKLKDEFIHEVNKEAAREVVHQMKLRNLSGMILVDFINTTKANEEDLMKYLTSLCKQDQVPTRVVDMTALGLVEITRKKIKKSLWEQYQMII